MHACVYLYRFSKAVWTRTGQEFMSAFNADLGALYGHKRIWDYRKFRTPPSWPELGMQIPTSLKTRVPITKDMCSDTKVVMTLHNFGQFRVYELPDIVYVNVEKRLVQGSVSKRSLPISPYQLRIHPESDSWWAIDQAILCNQRPATCICSSTSNVDSQQWRVTCGAGCTQVPFP